MHHTLHTILNLVLVRLDAFAASDVQLREVANYEPHRPWYRAQCGLRWTYVDRVVARTLRENGAMWTGDILKDPCAVA